MPSSPSSFVVAQGIASHEESGVGFRVAVVHTQWNVEVVHALRDGCLGELRRSGVAEEDVIVVEVRRPEALDSALL